MLGRRLIRVLLMIVPGVAMAADPGCPASLAILPGGPAGAIAVHGATIYWTQGAMLKIADISDPANPVVLGQTALPGMAREIRLQDDMLYAACGEAGVAILDVRQAGHPVPVAHYTAFNQSAVELEVGGCYLYVLDQWTQVLILDISDPTAPVRVGALTMAVQWTIAMTLQGSTLTVLCGEGIRHFDLANPVSPRLIQTIPVNDYAVDVAVSGSWTYLLTGYTIVPHPDGDPIDLPYTHDEDIANRIIIHGQRGVVLTEKGTAFLLDLSVPQAPRVIGNFRLDIQEQWYEPIGGAALEDGLLLAAHSDTGAAIWRITPEGRFDFQSGWMTDLDDFALMGPWGVGVTWGSRYDCQLIVTDLSMSAPVEAGRHVLPGHGRARLELRDNLAFVIMEYHGFVIVDLSDPLHPAFLSAFPFSEATSEIQIFDQYAYISTGRYANDKLGLHVLDISNPVVPVEVRSIQGDFRHLIVDSGRLYGFGECVVTVFDLSNPGSPHEIAKMAMGDGYDCWALEIKDSLAAASWNSNTEYGVGLWDIRDPLAPRLLSHVPVRLSIWDIWMDGGQMFVGEFLNAACDPVGCPPTGILSAWDITDPSNPSMAAYADTGWNIHRLGGDADRLAVLHRGKVTLYDRAALRPMPLLWSEAGGDPVKLMALQHPWAFSGDSSGVVRIHHMSDPTHPQTVAQIELPFTPIKGIVPAGERAFIMVGDMDIKTIHYLDLSDPLQPKVRGILTRKGLVGIAAMPPYLFLIVTHGSLEVYDWSDPDAPILAAELDVPSGVWYPVLDGGLLVALEQKGAVFCDISNPLHPVLSGSLAFPKAVEAIALTGSTAFITSDGAIWSVDAGDPANPVIVDSLPLRSKGIAVWESKLFSVRPSSTWNMNHSSDGGGVDVIDFADPHHLRHIGFYPAMNGERILVGSDYLYLTSDKSNPWVLDPTQCDGASDLPPIPRFSWSPTPAVLGEPVAFTAWNEGNPADEWEWDFGDGTTSLEQNPVHRFSRSGSPLVKLKASNAAGEGEIALRVDVRGTATWPQAGQAEGLLYVLPAAAKASGANGTLWATDLVLHNPTEDEARILLYTLHSSYDGAGTSPQEWRLNARSTGRYVDYAEPWGWGGPWLGALLVASDVPLDGWARIYGFTIAPGRAAPMGRPSPWSRSRRPSPRASRRLFRAWSVRGGAGSMWEWRMSGPNRWKCGSRSSTRMVMISAAGR